MDNIQPLSPSPDLFAALAKAQAQMATAITSSDNPFFKSKYADFGEIVRASRPALTAQGLSVIQRIILLPDGSEALHSVLGHASGQYIDSLIKIKPAKSDVQSLGSYITYLKRYTYAALVGVSTEDDDGEGSMQRNDHRSPNTITPPQIKALRDALSLLPSADDAASAILNAYKISSLDNLTQDQYYKSMESIQKSLLREKV